MNQEEVGTLVRFAGTGIIAYKDGMVREIVPLYEEISTLIESKEDISKEAFREFLPSWFCQRFNKSGYIFKAENIHRRTGLSFNTELEGKIYYKGDIEAWCDLVYTIEVKRSLLKYEILNDNMVVFYHDIPEFPCPLGDLEWALYACGADEILTTY